MALIVSVSVHFDLKNKLLWLTFIFWPVFKNHSSDTKAEIRLPPSPGCVAKHNLICMTSSRTLRNVAPGHQRAAVQLLVRVTRTESARRSWSSYSDRHGAAKSMPPPLTRPQSISQQSDKCVLVNRATASVRQRGRFTKNTIKYLSPAPCSRQSARLALMYLL